MVPRDCGHPSLRFLRKVVARTAQLARPDTDEVDVVADGVADVEPHGLVVLALPCLDELERLQLAILVSDAHREPVLAVGCRAVQVMDRALDAYEACRRCVYSISIGRRALRALRGRQLDRKFHLCFGRDDGAFVGSQAALAREPVDRQSGLGACAEARGAMPHEQEASNRRGVALRSRRLDSELVSHRELGSKAQIRHASQNALVELRDEPRALREKGRRAFRPECLSHRRWPVERRERFDSAC